MTTTEYLAVIPENIPAELKELKQWVIWKPEKKTGQTKPSKVSYSLQVNALTGNTEIKHASVNNPNTWMTFEDALTLMKSKKMYKGLNFVFPSTSVKGDFKKIVGVDLDHIKTDNNDLDPSKIEEIKALNTYAEVSPSGSGLRAICYAEFPTNEEVHKGDVEVYQAGKFLSITGQKLTGVPSTINHAQEAITAFRAKYFKIAAKLEEVKLPVTPILFNDDEIIHKLSNSKASLISESFKNLYFKGDTTTASGSTDHSAADFKLCGLLVYWTQDEEQIDRIFRKSKLMREKWDNPHGSLYGEPVTYGQRTIKNALLARETVFKGVEETCKEIPEFNLYPYKITTEGIFKSVPSRDNPTEINDVCISPSYCKISAIGDNVDTGEILYKLHITNAKKREKIYWKSAGDLLTRAKLLELINDGMHFKESNVHDIEAFFDLYIREISEGLPEEITASRSGWKQNYSTFVIGNCGYTNSNTTPILQLENNTAELYTQKGTLEGWKVGAEILLKYDAVRFKLYAACTPIILNLVKVSSFLQEQYGRSGLLKTLTGWFCASVWGNPIPLQINAKSTPKGIEAFVGYNTDLPVFIDETSTNEKEIKELIYTIANGVGRGTSNKSHGYEMPKTWSTVLLTTGENPILPVNAKMGQLVRNVPLKGGVDVKLDQDIITTVETSILENYGQLREPYIKAVFKQKENLKTIYETYCKSFPEVEDITSERSKKFYAAITTAGFLLEDIFKEIGITSKDPFEIVNNYFKENVISSTVFIPDYMRALDAVYSWFDANRIYFEELEGDKELNHERYGWIREKYICFNPNKIEEFVTKQGYNYLGCLEEWKNNGIILTRTKKNSSGTVSILPKTEIKVDKHNIQVIKIPLRQEDGEDTLKDSDDRPIDKEKKVKPEIKSPTENIRESLKPFYMTPDEMITEYKSNLITNDEGFDKFLEEEGY